MERSVSSVPVTSVTHWRTIDPNPNAPSVRAHLRTALLSRRRGRVDDIQRFLVDFASGRTVLDVGAIQHDVRASSLDGWKHEWVRRAARRVVGVDVLPEEVEVLRGRGYDIRCVDATSDVDLGERFDRVILGDVIEHVDNPVALLRFAGRHLEADGLVLCSTPNPFFVAYLARSVRDGTYIANAEHVAWITPSMALELGHRAGLELREYWHTQGDGKTPLRRIAVHVLRALGLRDSELFSGNFQYVFEHRSE